MMRFKVRLWAYLLVAWLCLFSSDQVYAQSTRVVPAATLKALLADPLPTPASGPWPAEVTVIEYFDYDCPVCRRIEPELRKLLARDSRVRLVHKDWPVFGDASEYAAYCSFAAAREGKYQIAHDALITSSQDLDSRADVQAVLRAVGFDMSKLDADVALHQKEYSDVLSRNQREAGALGLRGTPGLIVGNQLVLGAIDYAQLERLVSDLGAHR